jgi:hypothetical protein
MYDFVDQRVTSLDRGGRFLVWSMRSWVAAFGEGRCPSAALGPAFMKWGMIDALPHFAMAMLLLARHAHQPVSFAPLPCGRVREDEALMLGMFRMMRHETPDRVTDTIALIVEEDVVSPLFTALTALAMQLADASLIPEAPRAAASEAR